MGFLSPKNQVEKNLVEALCGTNWAYVGVSGLHHVITNNNELRQRDIVIRAAPHFSSFQFWAALPMRFSLEKEPRGLFARMLMRSADLVHCGWRLSIEGSCEATLFLFACMPAQAMNERMFDTICREIYLELRAFEKELSEKFSYAFIPQSPISTELRKV